MGAAASTQAEHDELRAVFERFKTSPGNGDDLDAAAFEADALVVPVRAADEDRDEAPRAKKARVVSCASFHDDEFARASRDALDLGGGATLLALDPGQFAAAVARVGALAEET